MKKKTEVRFPHSAHLFEFCRKVLNQRYQTARVIDQDVGQILGFDPADCSHWKNGKKNVRSIHAIKSIAEHLGVDEKLVVDVASGEMDEDEAFFELSGYGDFEINSLKLDTAKKNFLRRKHISWDKGAESEIFENLFKVDFQIIDKTVAEIHEKIAFHEAPLYLPEISVHYNHIVFKQEKLKNNNLVQAVLLDGVWNITFPTKVTMRPYLRFLLAKALAHAFLERLPSEEDNTLSFSNYVFDVMSNNFAMKLLVPERQLRIELQKVNVEKDIIVQLAETFWVSKYIINRRLLMLL